MKYSDTVKKMNFPNVLTDLEFNYYFSLFKEGDMCARDILINNNIRLVMMVIHNYFSSTDFELEELLSVGIVGLINSIDRFDLQKNRKFSTYAFKSIKNEIVQYINKEYKNNNNFLFSFDQVIGDDIDSSVMKDIYLDDKIELLEDTIINRNIDDIKRMIVINLINSLDDLDKKIIMMNFGFIDGKCYKQTEISMILDIPLSKVRWIIEKTLKKLKNNLLLDKEKLHILETDVFSKKLLK